MAAWACASRAHPGTAEWQTTYIGVLEVVQQRLAHAVYLMGVLVIEVHRCVGWIDLNSAIFTLSVLKICFELSSSLMLYSTNTYSKFYGILPPFISIVK